MSKSSKICKYAEKCRDIAGCKYFHSDRLVKPASVKGQVGATSAVKKLVSREVAAEKKHVCGKAVLKHTARVMVAAKALARASAVVQDYVKVDSKDSKVVKMSWADQEEVDNLSAQLSLMKTAARMAIGGQQIKIKLFVSSLVTSGVNSSLAGFLAVIPSSSAEWAGLISLYDECRVDSLEVMHLAGTTVSPTATVGAGVIPYAIGYDPTYNTTPGSNEDVQESQYSQLKAAPVSAGFDKPAAVAVDFHKFHVKIPQNGAVFSEDMKTKTNFPGSWMSCLDTVDSVGYIRYYIPTLGAAGISSIRIHYCANCEFRIRT